MSIEIKSGTLSDFFTSAKEAAKQIDRGERVEPKQIIWVDPKDLMIAIQRSPASLNNDLKILSKYDLVRISKETNPGHGVNKVIESSLGSEKVEFRVEI